jgi:hypothetical protein
MNRPTLLVSGLLALCSTAVLAASSPKIPLAKGGRKIGAIASAALAEAPAAEPGARSGVFGEAVLWQGSGDLQTVVWFASRTAMNLNGTLFGRITAKDGTEAATIAEPVEASDEFVMSVRGLVYPVRLQLAPGDYSAAFAFANHEGEIVATAKMPLHVPDASASFDASSLILASEPVDSTHRTFDLGGVELLPRADAAYGRAEKLWYFGQVVTRDPKKVKIDVRVCRGTETVMSFDSILDTTPLAPNRYVFGREVSLGGLMPGDYTIEVRLTDGGGASATRLSAFRIIP